MRYLVLIFCCVCILSCNSNWGNYGGYKLDYLSATNYYIELDKGKVITGVDSKEQQLKKGILVKFIRSSGKVDTVLVGKGGWVIEAFVDKNNIAFNDKYILVDQKPLSLIPFCGAGDGGGKECEEAIKKINTHQYWIIDKPVDYIYGPLTEKQFLSKRNQLKVPVDLKIETHHQAD